MISAFLRIAFITLVAGAVQGGPMAAAETGVGRPPAGSEPVLRTEDGFLKLGFDLLASFPITPPPFDPAANLATQAARAEQQIPAHVRAWHGKKAVVTGYMLPVKLEQEKVTELVLVRFTIAAMNVNDLTLNEWIVVRMKAGAPQQTLLPVSFLGVLKVGAIFENGYMVGIYELEAERMSATPVR